MTQTHRTKAYLDDRAHVFHSWSAQGLIDPVDIVKAEIGRAHV